MCMPNIRFLNYSDEWNYVKIKNLGDIVTGNTPSTKNINYWSDAKNNYVWATPADINSWSISETQKCLSELGWSQARIAPKNSVLVTCIASIGKNSINKVPMAFNQQINVIIPTGTDPYFILGIMDLNKNRFINMAGRTATLIINKEQFSNIEICITKHLSEQKLIGLFLQKIDDLTHIIKKKIYLLQLINKGFLQKLFVNNNSKHSEIRFSLFNDAWERRGLKEISERVSGNDGRMDLPVLTISAAHGWMDQKDRFSQKIAGKEQKNYTLLRRGELSYNHGNSKLAKYGVVYMLNDYEEALVPRVYHSFKVSEDPNFVEYIFATKYPDRELAKLVTSGARMDGLLNISYKEFMSISLYLPENIYEQKKISSLLRNVERTLLLYQRKLELLELMKKGFLQQIFI